MALFLLVVQLSAKMHPLPHPYPSTMSVGCRVQAVENVPTASGARRSSHWSAARTIHQLYPVALELTCCRRLAPRPPRLDGEFVIVLLHGVLLFRLELPALYPRQAIRKHEMRVASLGACDYRQGPAGERGGAQGNHH